MGYHFFFFLREGVGDSMAKVYQMTSILPEAVSCLPFCFLPVKLGNHFLLGPWEWVSLVESVAAMHNISEADTETAVEQFWRYHTIIADMRDHR